MTSKSSLASYVFYVQQHVERALTSIFQNIENYSKRSTRSVATSIFPRHNMSDPNIFDLVTKSQVFLLCIIFGFFYKMSEGSDQLENVAHILFAISVDSNRYSEPQDGRVNENDGLVRRTTGELFENGTVSLNMSSNL